MQRQKGFTLIELLIVLTIILVIAGIAIPSLIQVKINANEASAVASIRAIQTAQTSYYATYALCDIRRPGIRLFAGGFGRLRLVYAIAGNRLPAG